jgi:2-haloalkanoic acid dehalogenase type II
VNSPVRAVIFDYYGTLAELTPAQRATALDSIARRVGAGLAPGQAYRDWRGRTTRDTTLQLRADDRPPLDGERLPFTSFRDVWQRRFGELFRAWGVAAGAGVGTEAYVTAHGGALAYADAKPALDDLRRPYPLAVLSDADRDFLQASVERNGFAFDLVVASDELRCYKPHVSVFREVCARLGVEPRDAVYVGDTPWADVAGARNAGLRAVWLNRHARTWPEDIDSPESTITSLVELADALA